MKRYLLLLWSLLSVVSISAQTLNEAQIRQRVNRAAAAMKTMQCDFVQTKHLKMLNDDMVAQGKMYYQQSSKLRWEYTNPYTYTFVLNGDKVLLKNQQRNDVIDVNQNKIFREIARIMMSSVVGNSLLDNKTFKTTITINNSEWIATQIPQRKDMRQIFQRIVLHFNPQCAVVSCVEMIEKNGDKTVINLKNIRTNETLNASIFAVH
jgi:outer membrane lipoprotein carrier protein